MIKQCPECGEEKKFVLRKDTGKYRPKCADCHKKYCVNANLKNNYGITLEDYDRMFEEQNGKCAICDTEEYGGTGYRFSVDHNHTTGTVRALLCGNCNTGIGLLQEDPAVLAAAIPYLSKHKE